MPSLLRVERCRHSVEAFARTYFPDLVEAATPTWHFEVDQLIEDLYNHQDDKRALILAAPRGHGKTARISQLHTLHALLYGRENFIVLVSSTDERAEETLRPLKHALETNELIRKDFGNLVGSDYYPPQTWNGTNLILTWPSGEIRQGARSERPMAGRTAAIVARGVNSKMRGLRHAAFRPSLLLADDCEADENVNTPQARESLLSWLYSEAMPMLDPRSGKLVMVGTVLHFDSLLSKLLKRDDVYHTKIYRAIQEDGKPLWPEVFTLERLEKIRQEFGSRNFSKEYLNNPMSDSDRVFRPEWFKPYTSDEVVYDKSRRCWVWQDKPLRVYQGIDPAISERTRADDFACVTIGVTQDMDIIILDVFTDHIDFPSQIKAVEKLFDDWAPERIGIEEIGFQRAIRQQVLLERLLPIKRINTGPVTAKFTRIQNLDLHFENGKVYIRKALADEAGQPDFSGTLPWKIHHRMLQLYEQAVQYPDSSRDDILDALQIALQTSGILRHARAKRSPVRTIPAPSIGSRSRSFTLQDI